MLPCSRPLVSADDRNAERATSASTEKTMEVHAKENKTEYKRRKIKLATRRFKMSFQKSWHSPHNQLTLAVSEDCSFSPPLLHHYSSGDIHWTF